MKFPAANQLTRTLVLDLLLVGTLALPTPSYAQANAPVATTASKITPGSPPSTPALSQTSCESYLPVLTGKKKGSAMLADPRLRAIATSAVNLAKCGAVAADSDELCKLLSAFDGEECRRVRSVFHELRVNPKGRGFLMPDEDYENCRRELPKQSMPASFCDEFRAAARAGDPSKCPKGKIDGSDSWCRAIVSLDKSQCMAIGKIEDKEQGKAACEKIIDRNKQFAKGLDELAKSGSPLEQALAKAALGQADACKPLEADAMKACADQAPAVNVTPVKPQAPAAPPAEGATPKPS